MISRLKAEISQLIENELVTSNYEMDAIRIFPQKNRVMISILMDRKTGGITLDECADWNKRIGGLIEGENLIQGDYVVEVSSPGLDRKLKTPHDFDKVVNRNLHIHYRTPEGRLSEDTFKLLSVNQGQLHLESKKKQEGLDLALEDVVSAKLQIKV